jgi:hypothetical protein
MTTSDDSLRFPSFASLRAAHNDLLQRQREPQGGDATELMAAIESFLGRGQATGALLDAEADRRAAQSLLNYWTTALYRLGHEPPDATLAEFDPQLAPELPDELCPYLGLDAFTETRSEMFFGRERLVAELVNTLKDERLLAVLGPSGSGKSSVARAGLIPALKRGGLPGSDGWTFLPPIVPGSHPLKTLKVLETFRVLDAGVSPVVLVVDQFEEAFTLCRDDEERRAFVDGLVALIDSEAGHRVILTMRTDFEPLVGRLPEFQERFEGAVRRVTPLTAGELREAIEAPAAHIGLRFEAGVVDALLNDILGEPAALPLLQFTLLKLWEGRDRNRVTWETYKQLGGGRQALAKTADAFYEALIHEEQVTAKRILLRLVRPGEGLEVTSNRVRRLDLYTKAEAADRIDRVLDKFFRARLLRLTGGEAEADDQVEVAHEALVRNWPRLVEWLEEERMALRQRQRLTIAAEQWLKLGKDSSALWRGVLLAEAQRYDDLNELEAEFANAGRTTEEAEQTAQEAARRTERDLQNARALAAETEARRRVEADRRRIATALGVTAIGTAIIAIFFMFQSQNNAGLAESNAKTAQANAEVADINAKTAEAASTLAVALATDSANLAVTAQSAQSTAEADKNKAATLQAEAEFERDKAATAQAEAQASLSRQLAAQSRAYLSSNLELALLLSVEAHQTFETMEATKALQDSVERGISRTIEPLPGRPIPRQNGLVFDLAFSLDGTKLAWASTDTTVSIWDMATQTQTRLLGHPGPVNAVAFSLDGRWLASGDDGGLVIMWDMASSYPYEFYRLNAGTQARVLTLAFSPDSKLLAVGHSNEINLWNVAERQFLLTINPHGQEVRGLAWSPDSRYLASGGLDELLRVWKADTGEAFLTPTRLHRGSVWGVVWSADGKWIVTSGGLDQTLIIWDAANGAVLGQTATEHTSDVISIALSHDRKLLVSSSNDRSIYLWNVTDPQAIRPIAMIQDKSAPLLVTKVAFSPVENVLAFASGRSIQLSKITLPPQGDQPLTVQACELVGRNFTNGEWKQFFGSAPYRKTCEQWPEGK